MSFGHEIAELVAKNERGLLARHPSWERAALSDVAELLNGYPYDSGRFNVSVGMPLVRIRDILPGRSETRYDGPIDDPRMFQVRDGDLVVGMDGDFNSRIWKGGSALLNQRTCVLRTREGLYSQQFLAYVLPGYLKFINEHTSSVTVKHLSSKTVQEIPLPLPPLAEQKRIVARIDALFAEIDEGEAALASARKGLETFRRALLKSAVTGDLTKDWRAANPPTESGHDLLARIAREKSSNGTSKARARRATEAVKSDLANLPNLPDGWAWATIREIATVLGGLTKNPARDKMPIQAPYLRVANVQMGALDLDDMKQIGVTAVDLQRASLEAGDLLVVEGNGSIDQIGRCAIWNGEINGCVHQNHIIKVRFIDVRISNWCLTWLLSPHGRQEIEQVAASTSGLHTLSISKVEALPIPIPPPAEAAEILRRVSDALSAMDDTRTLLDAEASDAARLKQSILKSAFEGRLVPQDPNDEPATALLVRLADNPAAERRPRGRRKAQAAS